MSGGRLRLRQVPHVTISTSSPTSPTLTRPMRADARRNYAALIAAADEVFAEQGGGAALEEIAQRAGVGIGTLYRHFPSRRALILATIEHASNAVSEQGRDLLDAPAPREALETWLRALLEHASAYNGLGAEALRLPPDPEEQSDSCSALRTACAALLERAQVAGEVRADIDATDLFLMVYSLASAGAQVGAPLQTAERLLSLVFDGLRSECAPGR
jgi:AcrR family transcriptional regulator